MLYFVISEPTNNYKEFLGRIDIIKKWINELKDRKKILQVYQRVDKGSVMLLDVLSNEELHEILTEWMQVADCPVNFEIIPVIEPKILN